MVLLSPAVWQLPAPALPVGTGGGAAGNPRAAAESWMAQGFPSEAIHHALAAGDALMLRDITNHA
ncbi:hypothetical protein ACLB1T_09290 [Escherichia coli]